MRKPTRPKSASSTAAKAAWLSRAKAQICNSKYVHAKIIITLNITLKSGIFRIFPLTRQGNSDYDNHTVLSRWRDLHPRCPAYDAGDF